MLRFLFLMLWCLVLTNAEARDVSPASALDAPATPEDLENIETPVVQDGKHLEMQGVDTAPSESSAEDAAIESIGSEIPEMYGPFLPPDKDQSFYDPNEPENAGFTKKLTLQALNKVTARTSLIKAEVGVPVSFGNLTVTVEKCWKSAPEDLPESKALIDIVEQKPNEDRTRVFYGWMFASTPGISALQNPVYDITVVECLR